VKVGALKSLIRAAHISDTTKIKLLGVRKLHAWTKLNIKMHLAKRKKTNTKYKNSVLRSCDSHGDN
jgi:hypothetical protein